jgi:hypothetical protein
MAIRALPIASPCRESFAAMHGDSKSRFCDSCGKHVHDLSARTEEEARALLVAAKGTRICVRYAKDSTGAIRFRAAAVMAAAVSLASCAHPAQNATQPQTAAAAEEDRDMGDAIPDVLDVCPDQDKRDPMQDEDGCPEIDAGSVGDAGAPKP